MRNILIVEDERAVADVVAEVIEEGIPGATCAAEIHFDRAIERIAELRPDAIVLDLTGR